MRSSLIQLVFSLLVLVVAASAEELMPKLLMVAFPWLLASVQAVAARRALVPTLIFAIAAGGMEDAISSLPMMTSVSYFFFCALLVRRTGFPSLAMLLTYPGYQLWLALWTNSLGGGIFTRLLLAPALGLAIGWITDRFLAWVERKAAINEAG